MPTDLRFPFEWDETGDASSVEGQAFYEQHALLLGLIVIYDEPGQPMTATDLMAIESDLANVISGSPYFDEPVDVTILDSSDTSLDIRVEASNVSTFEVTV